MAGARLATDESYRSGVTDGQFHVLGSIGPALLDSAGLVPVAVLTQSDAG